MTSFCFWGRFDCLSLWIFVSFSVTLHLCFFMRFSFQLKRMTVLKGGLFFDQGFAKSSGSSWNSQPVHCGVVLPSSPFLSIFIISYIYVLFFKEDESLNIELDFSTKCTSRLCACVYACAGGYAWFCWWKITAVFSLFHKLFYFKGQSIWRGKGKEKDLTCNC